ncbi:MAG: DUF1203 domain-containing protein [Pseudomonadota bacterium]|nr:DUF1203 domain-containing protein [Pseudomonadota bacterium]
MTFRITGLSPEPFRHLFGLSEAELAKHGAIRMVADASPCYPDRIEVRDAEIGESLLLINYEHQGADTPYRASHAIFVREGAESASETVGELPEAMRSRMLSLRPFDARGMMVDAALVDGKDAAGVIDAFFADRQVAYIHAHYATRGCYAARIDRA